jgi:D-alanine-D-alanine ligase-like ATP-grasp enzyme
MDDGAMDAAFVIPPDLTDWPDDVHSGRIFHAARQRGIPAERIMAPRSHGGVPEPWLRLIIGGRRYFYSQAILISDPDPADSRQAHHVNRGLARLSADKHATKRLLAELGVPVPAGERFASGDIGPAEAMYATLGGPACVKPRRAGQGRQVYPWLRNPADFREAFRAAGEAYPELVVEEHVEGDQVRFFYVRPFVVGVRLDRPANVVGDGRSSIAELAAAKTEARRRKPPGFSPILLDREADRYLGQQGLARESRPVPGARVFLRGTSNPGTGGEGVDCRPFLHPSYGLLVEDFCGRMPELHLSAIDMMLSDPAAPAAPGNHWVLEVNSDPGLTSFYFPWEGEPQDVGRALIERLMTDRW